MRRIAIINQKGGVGKTTTAVNLAAALAELGQRVCVLDLDPQAHATTHLGVEPDGKAPSMYDVLVNSQPSSAARSSCVMPSTQKTSQCRIQNAECRMKKRIILHSAFRILHSISF